MFRKLEDFYLQWAYESQGSIKMFEAISDELFRKSDSENTRTIARLSWHITESITEMMGHAGLHINGISDASKEQSDIKKLIEEYKRASESLVKELKSNWNDIILDEKVPMYGDEWQRGVVLSVLIRHQSHHRGQLSVLLRQSGIVIPGMYGPTREEWIAMGLNPLV